MGVDCRTLLGCAARGPLLLGAANVQRPSRRPFRILGNVGIGLRFYGRELPGFWVVYASILAHGFLLAGCDLLFLWADVMRDAEGRTFQLKRQTIGGTVFHRRSESRQRPLMAGGGTRERCESGAVGGDAYKTTQAGDLRHYCG